jgi:hypothetical protein
MSLLGPADLFPELSALAQAYFRCAYGLLLLGTLLRALPHGARFFRGERWGGYAKSSLGVELLQNPLLYPFLMAGWLGAAALLVLGLHTVPAALANLALSYYFFIWMRWRGVLRGMGAPGFMTCWLAAAVFLLELTLQYAPGLRALALLTLQIDFAFIMFSAGFYKLKAGYFKNDGMEFGMVNPQWGYWYRLWQKVPPGHFIFRALNQLAWSTEIAAALLMLVPATRFVGALLIIGSFAFIATQIRLCLLCEMVMVGGILYFAPGTAGQQLLAALPWQPAAPVFAGPLPAWGTYLLGSGLVAYLLLLPLARVGLYINFYRGARLWRPAQAALEIFTNLFGIIIWRVFSADHTNFFVRVYRQRHEGAPRVLVSDYDRFGSRFTDVAEAIALTSVFTSLKYYPGDSALFRERLLRYARTIPCPAPAVLVFEYVRIHKQAERFVAMPTAEFLVEPRAGTVNERALAADVACLRSPNPGSPLRVGSRPGSYAA